MAIAPLSNNIYTCLSTDTKPVDGSYPVGTIFIETNKNNLMWTYDGTYWWPIAGSTELSRRRTGRMYGNLVNGDGLLLAMSATPFTGMTSSMTIDTTGMFRRFTTGTGADNAAGWVAANNFGARVLNPRMIFRFRYNPTTTDSRLYIGYLDNSIATPSTDDPLNTKSGFMFGVITTDLHWVAMYNSGAAQATQIGASTTLWDNLWHTVEIIGDDTNSKWGWRLDGGAFSFFTTSTPGQTTAMKPFAAVSNGASGAARTFDYNFTFIDIDSKP